MKISKLICQSCGVPIRKDYEKGIESKGAYSEAYCRHCYQLGAFTDSLMTVETMREKVRKKLIVMRFPRFLALLLADKVYSLKRWEG